MQNEIGKIVPKDLESLGNLQEWIKNNLHLYEKKSPTGAELLIFVNYIKQIIQNDKQIDRANWMKLVSKLEADIGSIKRINK